MKKFQKTKVFVFTATVLLSSSSSAFTDGSGWQIVTQLTSLLKTANEELGKLRESVSIGKKLEVFESAKAVKDISSLGHDLGGLFDEMGKTVDLFSYESDMGLSDVKSEFNDLIDRYEGLQGEEDTLKMLKGYANMLKSIENLSVLRDFHADKLKAISKDGMSEGDAVKQTAYSTSIQTQLLIEKNINETVEDARRTKAAIGDVNYMNNVGNVYGAMAGDIVHGDK